MDIYEVQRNINALYEDAIKEYELSLTDEYIEEIRNSEISLCCYCNWLPVFTKKETTLYTKILDFILRNKTKEKWFVRCDCFADSEPLYFNSFEQLKKRWNEENRDLAIEDLKLIQKVGYKKAMELFKHDSSERLYRRYLRSKFVEYLDMRMFDGVNT